MAHKVVAVASRSQAKAQAFVDSHLADDAHKGVKAYGSYEELYADPVSCLSLRGWLP